MREVWYAIPSANPHLCREHLPLWRDRGYRVAVLQNYEGGEIPADIAVWRDVYPGWAASVNELCAQVVPKTADIVVTGGDDMLPDPDRTAQQLAGEYFDRFPDGYGVMQPVGDAFMHSHEYCGSPWLGRGWIERAYRGRGPLHPEYRHNWADHELRWVSEAQGALWLRSDVSQRHAHFSRDGAQAPAYWADSVCAHDRADVELFMARISTGFSGASPDEDRVPLSWWHEKYPGTAHKYWASRYAGCWLSRDDDARLARALSRCAERGYQRVAIFGAGTATRESANALRRPPVTVVGLIDEHPSLVDQALWGYPIVSLEAATGLEIDAVVIHLRAGDDFVRQRVREALGNTVCVLSSRESGCTAADHELLEVPGA